MNNRIKALFLSLAAILLLLIYSLFILNNLILQTSIIFVIIGIVNLIYIFYQATINPDLDRLFKIFILSFASFATSIVLFLVWLAFKFGVFLFKLNWITLIICIGIVFILFIIINLILKLLFKKYKPKIKTRSNNLRQTTYMLSNLNLQLFILFIAALIVIAIKFFI